MFAAWKLKAALPCFFFWEQSLNLSLRMGAFWKPFGPKTFSVLYFEMYSLETQGADLDFLSSCS